MQNGSPPLGALRIAEEMIASMLAGEGPPPEVDSQVKYEAWLEARLRIATAALVVALRTDPAVRAIPLGDVLAQPLPATKKRPPRLIINVPEDVLANLDLPAEDRDLFVFVQIPNALLRRQTSPIILPT